MTKQTKKTKRTASHSNAVTRDVAYAVEAALDDGIGQVEVFEAFDEHDEPIARLQVIPGASHESINRALFRFDLKLGDAVEGDEFNRIRIVKIGGR